MKVCYKVVKANQSHPYRKEPPIFSSQLALGRDAVLIRGESEEGSERLDFQLEYQIGVEVLPTVGVLYAYSTMDYAMSRILNREGNLAVLECSGEETNEKTRVLAKNRLRLEFKRGRTSGEIVILWGESIKRLWRRGETDLTEEETAVPDGTVAMRRLTPVRVAFISSEVQQSGLPWGRLI